MPRLLSLLLPLLRSLLLSLLLPLLRSLLLSLLLPLLCSLLLSLLLPLLLSLLLSLPLSQPLPRSGLLRLPGSSYSLRSWRSSCWRLGGWWL
jgi:hypothetical protein